MATNFINAGIIVHITLAAARESGEFALIQNQMLVFQSGGDIGAEVAAARSGQFKDAPKPGDEAWTRFETLYWDEGAGEFTIDSNAGANPAVAVAAEDAATADTKGSVILQNAAAL